MNKIQTKVNKNSKIVLVAKVKVKNPKFWLKKCQQDCKIQIKKLIIEKRKLQVMICLHQ